MIVAILGLAEPLVAETTLVNGSFEEGKDAPTGWRALAGGKVRTTDARHGERCVTGESSRGAMTWMSDIVEFQPDREYRLEGWIRCSSGEARLRTQLMDGAGRIVASAETPRVRPSGWRYVAVEFNSQGAAAGRVVFWVHGKADLDAVNLGLVETSFMGNKGVETDERGRIPFWSEERTDMLLPGRRAGELKLDTAIKREGKGSVRLTPSGDWFAVASVNYPVAAWTERLELSGWARCAPSATARLLACWTDDGQNLLRVDTSTPGRATNWERLSVAPAAAPVNAAAVRLVAVALGGPVWFDEFELLRLRPREPRVEVFVNQIGYERTGPKSAVVASNFFPQDTDTIGFELIPASRRPNMVGTSRRDVPARVKASGTGGTQTASSDLLVAPLHAARTARRAVPTPLNMSRPVTRAFQPTVWKQTAVSSGRIHSGQPNDWGWYFWRADFSRFRQPGAYRVVAKVGPVTVESAAFVIGRNLLLSETAQSAVDFFHIQRCGFDVPGWHKACHLDDAKLPDGNHLDATGGWHSAGDYNKLMYEHGDGGVVFALLKAYDSAPKIFGRFDRDDDEWADALDEANWGAAFVAKMQIPESGGLRNHVNQGPGRNWTKWSIPEVHTDNRSGTEDDPVIQPGEGNSPLVIAGWARLSTLLSKKFKSEPKPLTRPSATLSPHPMRGEGRERGVSYQAACQPIDSERTKSSSERGHSAATIPHSTLDTPPSDYLARALRLWTQATKSGTAVGSPYLLISAIELHRAAKDPSLLDWARRAVDQLLSQQATDGPLRGAFGSYGDTSAAALAQFALAYPREERSHRIRRALELYVAFCSGTADHAFGLSPQAVSPADTFFPADLGHNFQLLSRAWAAALAYRVTRDPRALRYSQDHVDWVLGKNPVNLCMFEGKGAFNPPRYHHRYNMIPGRERGAVPGTIPNGFVRDMGLADRPGFDLSRTGGRAPSYRTSEPWLVHNLFYLLAASALDQAVGK
ncbi:MAG: glycoside hydrolase family 9 protein [Verrucomicrobia bacterium]|nr:glycoside hydrolase family 9 protein [Verrucomicrobiota bacterium]